MIRKFFQSLGCFALYSLYLFLFLEVASRLILNNPTLYQLITRGKFYSDVVWRHNWIHSQKNKIPQADSVNSYREHDPIKGWRLKSLFKDMQYNNTKLVTTNSKGVRGSIEYDYKKTPGKKRIVILGESFTFGTEVSDTETYPFALQKLLPQAEVINLGVGGYGYDQMLLTLLDEGEKYKPDIVIIPFLEVDMKRGLLSFRDYAKSKYVLRNNKLILTHVPVPPPEEMLKREFWRSKFIDMIQLLSHDILEQTGIYQKREKELTLALLHEMVNRIKSMQATPLIAYLEGIRDPLLDFKQHQAKQKEFTEYWRENGVECIYLFPYIKAADAMLLKSMGKEGQSVIRQREFRHFNPRENFLIGYGLYDFVRKNNLF